MNENYPIKWLDTLISSTLNPRISSIENISQEQSSIIIATVQKESLTIKSKIKYKVFSLTREKHISLFIINHYKSFQILQDQIVSYENYQVYNKPELKQILRIIEKEIQELLSFIELWYPDYLQLDKKTPPTKPSYKRKFTEKVLCNLSTDQTAILLRAADDSKILVARSMRSVFKAIIPHLSTPYKRNISYDSVRVKSYNIEEKDKIIAIKHLQLMIDKIKSY